MGYVGFGANPLEDTVYGVSQLDSELNQLEGESLYHIHFDAGQLPPTNAFWSITNYDNEGYFEENDWDLYSLGSNHTLKYNADGSLDMYMSHEPPTDDALNWIPTPKDNFKVLLRLYWPQESALNGEWSIPPILKAS
ncbi:MAG: hypothetical protein ACI9FB_000830 [Candidatus Azotimanducaceae bacterium]